MTPKYPQPFLALQTVMPDFAPSDPLSVCYDVVNWNKQAASSNPIFAYEFTDPNAPTTLPFALFSAIIPPGPLHAAEIQYLFPGSPRRRQREVGERTRTHLAGIRGSALERDDPVLGQLRRDRKPEWARAFDVPAYKTPTDALRKQVRRRVRPRPVTSTQHAAAPLGSDLRAAGRTELNPLG